MRKMHIKYIGIVLLIFFLSSCNFLNVNPHFIRNLFQNNSERVLRSYSDFIQTLKIPGSNTSLIQSGEELQNDPLFEQFIQKNSSIQYLPATLWQVYALKNKLEWKEHAEKFSGLMLNLHNKQPYNEAQLYSVCMNSYRISGNQQFKQLALQSLSGNLTEEQYDKANYRGDHYFRVLLEARHLLFATKDTGDPIYKRFAISSADNIYRRFFEENISNEVFYGLLNWDNLPGEKELEILTTSDFYKLAVTFYGFTILDNEIGIKHYNELNKRLDKVFRGIFETVPGDREPAPGHSSVAQKIDLTSRALICLGLQNFNNFDNRDDNTAEKVFESILNDLEISDNSGSSLDTLRLYYYLFEYVAD